MDSESDFKGITPEKAFALGVEYEGFRHRLCIETSELVISVRTENVKRCQKLCEQRHRKFNVLEDLTQEPFIGYTRVSVGPAFKLTRIK